jgi:N-acetylglucosamine kinase-like BadF-type ATPase
MTPLYLGVDAGNSKTVVLLCTAAGEVVGSGRSGNGDIYGASSERAAVEAVFAAVNESLTAAGARPDGVGGAAFRLAGVDWPEDHAFWVDALAAELPDIAALRAYDRCSIANDGFAAIRCGELTGTGVALIAGTGSAVAGRGPGGDEWSMSFWIQDAHGASGLVASALRAVYRAELGLGPTTVLTKRLLAYFGYADVDEMLHQFTRRGGRPSRPWHTAAREVAGAAADRDAEALRILREHGEHLADYARVTAARVGFVAGRDEVPVVLAGSVMHADASPVRAAVQAALPERFPDARPRLATLPPVAGAALDALAEAGVAVTAEVVARLRASMPPPAFTQT